MPTADGTYQTVITINGKVDDAIFKGIARLGTETGKIVKQEKELGTESKKSFELLEKGMAKATVKGKELALAMKDMLLPLLGISVAFKGLQTIGDTLQTAIDKFKGAKQAAAAFKASVQDVVGKGRVSLFETFFGTQSEHVLGRFKGPGGPIYGRGITRAVQQAFIQQHIQPSNALIQAVIEKAVQESGELGVSPDELKEIATKWATFMKLPKGRIPQQTLSEFGLGSLKEVQALSREQKEKLLEKEFGGMTDVEQMIAANPHMAELLGLKVRESKALGEAGGPLADLQTQGQIVSVGLEMAFLPVLKTISEAIDKNLAGPMEVVKQKVMDLDAEMKKIFTPTEADKKAGYSEDIFANVAKAWREDIIPQLKADWQLFVDWAVGIWKGVGDQFNLWREDIRSRGAKRIDIGYGITVPEQPGAKNMDQFVESMIKMGDDIGKTAVNLAQITASMVKVSWETMQKAVVDLAAAATQLANAINLFPKGNPEEATQLRKELEESGALPKSGGTRTVLPFKTSGFASGGFINAPQVGLVGEAGRESIVPLTKRDSNTLDILAGTFSALGINPVDPNAYGHELFDATRMGPGGYGGGAPGMPGFSGMAGGIFYTEYGPSIDPPGSADYDSNSYNRIGAWPGITGRLTPGDVALGYGAQAFYGVRPGQTFTDTRGNTVRFADRSGSKNPMNEDVFRLAAGGIVSKKILSFIGEAGKEAVIPLEGARGKRALAGLGGGSTGHTFNFSPVINVSGVATDEVAGNIADELRRNFGRWVEEAHFEHERRSFS